MAERLEAGLGIVPPGLPQQVGLQLFQELIVVTDHLQVGFDTLSGGNVLEAIEHVTVAGVLQHSLEGIEVVLLGDHLDVRQELAAASHQKGSSSEQIPRGPHLARIESSWKSILRPSNHSKAQAALLDNETSKARP